MNFIWTEITKDVVISSTHKQVEKVKKGGRTLNFMKKKLALTDDAGLLHKFNVPQFKRLCINAGCCGMHGMNR